MYKNSCELACAFKSIFLCVSEFSNHFSIHYPKEMVKQLLLPFVKNYARVTLVRLYPLNILFIVELIIIFNFLAIR